MKKHILTLMLVMLSVVTFGQQWVAIKSDAPSTIQTELVASSESSITVNLQVPGFYAFEVTTPQGEANIISVPRTVSTAAAGEPDLPMIAVPVLIGDRQHYNIRVVNAQYTDFQMEVAPSKGDFPRTINPEDVPYTYGEAYTTDAFFPAQNVGLYEPYIMRDFRGQNMVVYPFAYNAVTHTLRVYYNMTVELFSDGIDNENIIDRRSNAMRLDPEIEAMYANHFINYSESLTKYTPVVETGELLIICHDAFMSAMQPFVNWKKQIGRPTTMVGTSTTGTNDTSIKTYIQNQYDANSNLTHVLLVGDVAQIPGHNYSSGSYGGKSDNWYGQVAGNDYYNDIIVGRFSAENTDHVTTQVNKVIHYERDINASDTWLSTGTGVATVAGSGGHFGEDDWQHIDNIRNDLLGYNYTEVFRDYPSGGGANSNSATLTQHINNGVSIINYCNHGSETSWGVFNYSNSNVNALINDQKLPIVWSVACLNGKYDHYQPCFGETWMRATNNSNGTPTGAIGGMFSYISQPWVPPMYGQDEMVDVLVENYATNIKRTLGGCSFDGNMKILDQYGQGAGQGHGTYMSWILYGDPTLTLRNAVPANMNVTHASTMNSTATSFTVNATNGNGALATLTLNNEIMGSATINNGTANITFTAPGTTGTATLTVFGYNKITYIGSVTITQGGTTQYTVNVSANPHEGGNVTGGGTYNQGQSCTVTASPSIGYTFVNWTENGNVVSSQANYTFTVNGNRNLVANFQAMPQNYTINVSANPALGGNVTGGGTYQEGQSCTVTASANTGYVFVNWTENGNVVSNQANYTFTVNGNRTLVAQFQQQTYTISVSANPALGGNVTGGGTYTQGQSCTVTATANAGYTFTNWTENGNVVSTNANYTFTVTGNRTLVANFAQQQFTITALVDPSQWAGGVEGGGTYTYGQSCTLTATPTVPYIFVNWTKDGVQVSTNATYTFTVTESATYVAHFVVESFTITTLANPTEGGVVTGSGTYETLDECTVTATANEGYDFVNWTEDGEPVSDEQSYSFTVTSNRMLTANFVLQSFQVKVIINPEEAGSVTGEGTYNYGDEVTLTVVRNEDWAFQNWTEDGEVVWEELTYTFIITNDRVLEANFLYTEGIGENSVSAKVYPNPTKGEVMVESEGLSHIRIVNAYGQTVYNAKVEGEQVRIDLSQMGKGIYMMHIEANGGQTVRKIMVE
ncbi:MAG: T9SS type A sorting domain-containing protein [Bacteroidales bacterium]|nr:T9SS type A sorting domain-containing protein [Bacteroidales bacterium]